MDVEEAVSDQKNKYIVLCDPEDSTMHVCGCFVTMDAAQKCLSDDHVDTGTPLTCYVVEAWRGRQFNGAWDHAVQLIARRDDDEET